MTVIDLIKLIKPIPELFIRKHSIFSLEVFIDGWCYRDIKGDAKEEAKEYVLYTEFYEWLQEKYKVGGSGGWVFVLFNTFYKEKYNSSLW